MGQCCQESNALLSDKGAKTSVCWKTACHADLVQWIVASTSPILHRMHHDLFLFQRDRKIKKGKAYHFLIQVPQVSQQLLQCTIRYNFICWRLFLQPFQEHQIIIWGCNWHRSCKPRLDVPYGYHKVEELTQTMFFFLCQLKFTGRDAFQEYDDKNEQFLVIFSWLCFFQLLFNILQLFCLVWSFWLLWCHLLN